jgi:photosystem II stability/assembly factor-like uncharacterized protein
MIFKTTDGGTTWMTQDLGSTDNNYGVHFPVDALTGYVVGIDYSGGTILKTTDGGSTWLRQISGSPEGLYTVHFPTNAMTGYISGWFGTLLKTTNGGSTWLIQASGTTNSVNSVDFPLNDQTGYAVGNGGTILKTTNGGVWVETSSRQLGGSVVRQLKATPNPFISFATLPGHETERFALYDIAGRRVGTCKGERIGVDLRPGVYFIRALDREAGLGRIVKVR